MRLTDAEWAVLEALWSGESFALGELAAELKNSKGWNKNTVYTYLTRMAAKGLVNIDRSQPKPYSAAVSRYLPSTVRFVTCVFAEELEPGKLVEKGVYVKMARGEMVRFAAENHVSTPEGLQGFQRLGYTFAPQLSNHQQYVFRREGPKKR